VLDSLTLDQLRILVTVSEAGSFSAAGRRLRRVQSAISQSIQTLEATHGVKLFDRSTKTPVLTDVGRVLVDQARQVLRQADSFTNLANAMSAGLEPELTLAIASLFPTDFIIESLKALQAMFPNLPVTLFTEGVGSAERRLRTQTVELAILPTFPAAVPDLQTYPLGAISLVPVAASSHPLGMHKGAVTRDMLQDHIQLVLTDPFDASGPSYGVVSPRIWRFVELSKRLEFLLAGFGWANMPTHLVEPHLRDGTLRELAVDDPSVQGISVPIFAIHERNRPPGKAGRWLLEDLQRRRGPRAVGT
jgi:DNA-binding transcriptional LysR family regulator